MLKWMLCLGVLFFLDQLPALAQAEKQTKVTITKETIDAEGNKTTESIVLEGEDAEAIDIDKLAKGETPPSSPQMWLRGFDQKGPMFFNGEDSLDLSQWFSFDFEPFKFFGDEDFGNSPFLQPFGSPTSKGPKLGVQIQSLESQKGVVVSEVVPGSVAERAGLQTGDIILMANDQSIDEPANLVEIIQSLELPAELLLNVLRGDEYLDIVARFEEPKEKKNIQIRKI